MASLLPSAKGFIADHCPNGPFVELSRPAYRAEMSPSALTKLAFAAAATCIATAVVYLVVPASEYLGPPRGLVFSAGLVGGISLAVVGRWQQLAAQGSGALPLATLTALAGAYLLTNVSALTFPLGAWRITFIIGIIFGAALFVAGARALLRDQHSAQHA
jgi:hypothetical protein